MKKVTGDQNSLRVYDVGTEVTVGSKTALIIEINIGPKHIINYKVVWWVEDERFEAWINEIEVSNKKPNLTVHLENHMPYAEYEESQDIEPFGFARGRRDSTKKQLH